MDERKCLHVPCKCSVAPGVEYCSIECQGADLSAGAFSRDVHRCDCHHPDCEFLSSAVEVAADPSEALAGG